MPVFDQFKACSRRFQRGIFVTGIGSRQFSGGDLQDAQPDRHKHLLGISIADLRIDGLQYFGGALFIFRTHCRMPDQGHGDHHKQRCRNTFSGDIRNDQAQVVVVDQEKVVKVAADFLGGLHGCEEIKFLPVRKGRKVFGKRAQLYTCCK